MLLAYGSRSRPDLHSFPTRRSSDLTQTVRRLCAEGAFVKSKPPIRDASDRRRFVLAVYFSRALAAARPTKSTRDRRDSDRKSTRLNSSHTVISYAVFCLKKKSNTTM